MEGGREGGREGGKDIAHLKVYTQKHHIKCRGQSNGYSYLLTQKSLGG